MRARRRLRGDDLRALQPDAARRLAVELNTERAAGRLPGPPTLTGGGLLGLAALRSAAEEVVRAGVAGPGAAAPAADEAARADDRGGGVPTSVALAEVVDLVTTLLLDPIPEGRALSPLLAPAERIDVLPPALRGFLDNLPTQAPEGLVGRLHWVRLRWADRLDPATLARLVLAADLIAEEIRGFVLRAAAGPIGVEAGRAAAADTRGPVVDAGFVRGPTETPDYAGLEAEPERFSIDTEWMPTLVLQSKATFVWLDQLSRRHGREIRTLDAIPDEELDRIAASGVTGLWLIGVWQRSRASAAIKQRRGNPDAAASAYAIDEYRVADELGGESALADLAARAAARGIRLAGDMVPNHMGLDSRWVLEHPEWFLGVPASPFPAYSFDGPDLSSDPDVELVLEDHYWDATDAAVVFRRRDRRSGETRFLYHGNDGTSFPWNDTAQLDYLRTDVREAVIGTILEVARRFPVIRFDAAMVLARRHVRRLWWPAPGGGGAIPSRAEHAMSDREFAAAVPREFWREVVDRVAAEAPGTLLLAEAFWLLEGYFVRTLGMHRVYNSAFMHMLRDEDGPGYRKVIRDTLAFDPGVLGRFVNFLTNPDEASALEQFGSSGKYFGAAMVLATMPGLPMLGHGQLEGLGERYGHEFRRALRHEPANADVVAEHERLLVPLLRSRRRFAGSADFRLYDVVTARGKVDEHVYAYSNGRGQDRSLVVYHDRFGSAAGRIRDSVEFSEAAPDGGRHLVRSTLADAMELPLDPSVIVRFHDPRLGVEVVATVEEIRSLGLPLRLDAYAAFAFTEITLEG